MPFQIPFLRCNLKCPPLLIQLLLIFRPFKSLSLLGEYFQVSQEITDGSNRKARHRLHLLTLSLLYFLALNIHQILAPLPPPLDLVFLNSAKCLSPKNKSAFFNYFYLIQTCMTLFYYYLFYQGDNRKINRVMKRLLAEKPRPKSNLEHLKVLFGLKIREIVEKDMPSIAWCAINTLQPFILIIDVLAGTFILQLEWGLFKEYGQYFTGSLVGILAYLVHLGHVLLALIFWYSFAHIHILSTAYILTIMTYLFVELGQCKALLCRTTLSRFLSDSVALYRLIFAADRHYRAIFLTLCSVNLPLSAFITMRLCLGQVHGQERLIVLSLDIQEFIAVFLLHLLMAQFSQRLMKMGKSLAGWLGKKERDGGNFRIKLTFYLALCRLYTVRPYGLTYGGLAVINLATLTRCLLLYGKFLRYSFKIIHR